MRTLATLATMFTLLLFLAISPAFAQDSADSPAARPNQQDEKATPEERKQDQKDQKKVEKEKQKEQQKDVSRDKKDENRMPEGAQSQDHRTAQSGERAHGQPQRGKRIPDEKFRANFGGQHTFHVSREQVVNVSQPVVVYGGYSFGLIDPWPVDWGFNDDVYIDYVDDGYYLFNPFHPGVRIAVFVAE